MAGRFGAHKDVEKMIRKARHQGFNISMTKGNHIKFVAPSGEIVIGGLTSNTSGVLQLRRRLQKAGYRP